MVRAIYLLFEILAIHCLPLLVIREKDKDYVWNDMPDHYSYGTVYRVLAHRI